MNFIKILSTLCLLLLAQPLYARSILAEIERFRSPIADTNPQLDYAHGLDFDASSGTFWAAVNSPRTVWSFNSEGVVSEKWPIFPQASNVLSVGVHPTQNRVFRYQTPSPQIHTSTQSGSLIESLQFPANIVPASRLDYDSVNDLIVLPYIDHNTPSNSGFLRVTPGGSYSATTEAFDFVAQRNVGSVLGFSVTPDSYWLLHDQGFLTEVVLTKFDRSDLNDFKTFGLPDPGPRSGVNEYTGLAVDLTNDLIYTQDRIGGDIVGLRIVPEPSRIPFALLAICVFILRNWFHER